MRLGEDFIRVAQAHDADAIGRLVRASIRETLAIHYSSALIAKQCDVWSAAHVGRLMQSPDRVMLVAARGDEIVGTACLCGNSLRKVFVDPKYQRAGIGRRLIGRVELTATSRGVDTLHVQSTVNAAAFYAQLGFRFVDTADVQGEPFVLMQKNL